MSKNIFSEILSLSEQLSIWQNEGIRRLFSKGSLSESDISEIFKLAKIEYGIISNHSLPDSYMLKSSDLPTPPGPGKKIQLNAIRDLTDVNALRGDGLSIDNKLTIIYGENASGKSGYARVMKKAFRARVVDPIIPNV